MELPPIFRIMYISHNAIFCDKISDIRRINKLFAEYFRRIGDIISEYDFPSKCIALTLELYIFDCNAQINYCATSNMEYI